MTVKAKIFSLVAQADGSAREDDAWTIMRVASAKLHEADVHHNLGFMDAEEGPEPSVWRDAETDTVILRVPAEHAKYFHPTVAIGSRFKVGVDPQSHMRMETKSYLEISEDWEVLA